MRLHGSAHGFVGGKEYGGADAALRFPILDHDQAVMHFGELASEAEPQAGSLARCLGGEERIKDGLEFSWGNPSPAVHNLDDDRLIRSSQAYA